MHKFNPSHHKKLNSKERHKITPPELLAREIEKEIEVYSNNGEDAVVIADAGCGSGFFSLPIMKGSGEKNIMLFALDISEEMLGVFNVNMKKEISESILPKVRSLKCEESFLPLADKSVNIILLANVFHEIENKMDYLAEIRRVLKDGGVIFLLDWSKDDVNPVMGPPITERVSEVEASGYLKRSGFKDISIVPIYLSSFVIKAKS